MKSMCIQNGSACMKGMMMWPEHLSHDLVRYHHDIVPWDIAVHFVVVSDVNNGVMTTPAANNGHDDVTELPVTSQWFGML